MPAERWPKAARERMANPPAGTALAPLFRHAFRKGALNERGGRVCNRNEDGCQEGDVPILETLTPRGLFVEILLKANEGIADGGHTAKLVCRIRDRMIFELQQIPELFLIQFADALPYVLRKNKIQEGL